MIIKMSITVIITMTMIKIMIDKKMTTMIMMMITIIALKNVEAIGQSLHTISLSVGVIHARGKS